MRSGPGNNGRNVTTARLSGDRAVTRANRTLALPDCRVQHRNCTCWVNFGAPARVRRSRPIIRRLSSLLHASTMDSYGPLTPWGEADDEGTGPGPVPSR